MELLLDTHALIWFAEGDDKLSPKAKSAIETLSSNRFVSIVSVWEIVIKSNLNKLNFKKSIPDISKFLFDNDIELLSVDLNHLNTLSKLEYYHRDPFDRLLISQALTENLTIISADQHFKFYPVSVVW